MAPFLCPFFVFSCKQHTLYVCVIRSGAQRTRMVVLFCLVCTNLLSRTEGTLRTGVCRLMPLPRVGPVGWNGFRILGALFSSSAVCRKHGRNPPEPRQWAWVWTPAGWAINFQYKLLTSLRESNRHPGDPMTNVLTDFSGTCCSLCSWRRLVFCYCVSVDAAGENPRQSIGGVI